MASGWDGKGGHRHEDGLSIEEATKAALERNQEWARRPDVIERKQLAAERVRLRLAEEAGRRQKASDLIGPHNPFKAHRR